MSAMGRQALPLAVIQARGRTHLTKKQIEEKKAAELKLGSEDIEKIEPPGFVKNDLIAYGHWKKTIKEYKKAAKNGVEILKSSDTGLLAMYCKTLADYERLQKSYQSIDKIAFDSEQLEDFIDDEDRFSRKVQNQLRAMISVDGLLRIETAINKKLSVLMSMQDRLFLNPLSKVKNVPKKQDKPPENPADEFGI